MSAPQDFEAGFRQGALGAAEFSTNVLMGVLIVGMLAGLALGWWIW